MKRIFTILAMAALLLTGCEKETSEPIVAIKLEGMPTTDFTVGCSVTISAVITPDDATDKSVTFTSSNPEVATVEYTESENNYSLALLKAVGPGKATITATVNDGSGVKDEAEVTVIPNKTTFTSTANCYIVTKPGEYTFKAVKGNSSESVGEVASAAVLWESFGTDVAPAVGDLVKDVSYKDGEITFTATDKKGNAVIAAKDAARNILWSWHIWLTDQPKEQEYYHIAGTMMDRNLGATSATPGDVGALGLLYQWGRKDPFLGSSSISSSTVAKSTTIWPSAVSSDSSKGTIEYAIANPTTFITYNNTNFSSNNWDWYYYYGNEVADNTRWTRSKSSKSIYDPCPSGWRVPDGHKNGIWSNALGSSSSFTQSSLYDSTNKGMNLSGKFGPDQTIWYPASGFYGGKDGCLYDVGNIGIYWSAPPIYYDNNSLRIDNDGTVALDSFVCAFGNSVRCVKE